MFCCLRGERVGDEWGVVGDLDAAEGCSECYSCCGLMGSVSFVLEILFLFKNPTNYGQSISFELHVRT